MSPSSRRAYLRRLSTVPIFAGISGCATLLSVDATIRFVNDYKYDETATFYVRRGTELRNPETVRISPGEERVFERSVRTGDSVLVTKKHNRLPFKLQRSVCFNPKLTVNIGGLISGGWSC